MAYFIVNCVYEIQVACPVKASSQEEAEQIARDEVDFSSLGCPEYLFDAEKCTKAEYDELKED